VSKNRENQRYRTRRDLQRAAARLLRQGVNPTMTEVAREAAVSRATAYRYYPSLEALLCEATLDSELPEPEELFDNSSSADPVERVFKAEQALRELCRRNEARMRATLVYTIKQAMETPELPCRQNRRTPLIEKALEPALASIDGETADNLIAALAVVFGAESMIVFRDVLRVDDETERRVKSWMMRVLVEGALNGRR
jgi:AcrR family transcriptional regulator